MPVHSAAHKLLLPLNNPPKIVGTPVSGVGSSVTSTTTGLFSVTGPTYLVALGYCYSLSSTVLSMKWSGITMSVLTSALEGSYIRLALFGLQVPAANIPVQAQFVLTSPNGYTGIIGFGLPGTFTAIGATGTAGNSGNPSITVPTALGRLVVGGIGCWNTPSISNGTQVGTTVSGTDTKLVALQSPGGASSSVLSALQSSTNWTAVGASLRRVSA